MSLLLEGGGRAPLVFLKVKVKVKVRLRLGCDSRAGCKSAPFGHEALNYTHILTNSGHSERHLSLLLAILCQLVHRLLVAN